MSAAAGFALMLIWWQSMKIAHALGRIADVMESQQGIEL